ncbi:MAG TPA: hypothetical protein VF604_11480 [Pyrinomonadaceae bacterium]|jgi:tetratricopeptide (TPR) repeat protein
MSNYIFTLFANWAVAKGFEFTFEHIKSNYSETNSGIDKKLDEIKDKLETQDLIYYKNGIYYLNRGEYKQALDNLVSAYNSSSKYLKWSPLVRYQLACAYRLCGNKKAAEEHFIEALELNPYILPTEEFFSKSKFKEKSRPRAVSPEATNVQINQFDLNRITHENIYDKIKYGLYKLWSNRSKQLNTLTEQAAACENQIISRVLVSSATEEDLESDTYGLSYKTAKAVFIRSSIPHSPRRWVIDASNLRIYMVTPKFVVASIYQSPKYRIISSQNGEKLLDIDKDLFQMLFSYPDASSRDLIKQSVTKLPTLLKDDIYSSEKQRTVKNFKINDATRLNQNHFEIDNIWYFDKEYELRLYSKYKRFSA